MRDKLRIETLLKEFGDSLVANKDFDFKKLERIEAHAPNLDLIEHIMKFDVAVFINSDGKLAVNVDGIEHVLPLKMHEGDCDDLEKTWWIGHNLPKPPFSVNLVNTAHMLESQALYTCAIVAAVEGGDLSDEFRSLLSIYKFEDYCGPTPEQSFNKMLTKWKGLNSLRVNILITGCRYQIINTMQSFDESLLMKVEKKGYVDEAKHILELIRNINRKKMKDDVEKHKRERNCTTRTATKLVVDERNNQVNALLNSVPGRLAAILMMGSDYVNPSFKNSVETMIKKGTSHVDKEKVDSRKYSRGISRFRNYILSSEIEEIKKREIDKFNENPSSYKLLAKV